MSARFPPRPVPLARYIICGTFIDAPTPTALRVRRDCEVVVDVTGTIESITEVNEDKPREKNKDGEEVRYIKLKRGQVVCPGLIDCVRICCICSAQGIVMLRQMKPEACAVSFHSDSIFSLDV